MNPSFHDDALVCPSCGGDYLHHGAVCSYTRIKEDSADGTAYRIDGSSIARSSQLNGNPSARRDGITIDFNCELCGNTSTLGIAQHKGQTQLSWQPRQWTVISNQDGGIG